MSEQTILLNITDGVATLTFNRPDKRNAMNDAMRAQYIETLERISADKTIRALVLTGAGKGFCAGGDIAGMEKRLDEPQGTVAFNGWTRQLRVHYAVNLLHKLTIPTIAAVNGPAAGLGADLAMSCDFVVAGDSASFTWSYIHRGLVPDGGGLYFLPRRTGLVRAKELIFSGRTVDAKEALQTGIADRLSPQELLLEDAVRWADELSRGSHVALALSKTLLNESFEMTAEQVFAKGSQAQGICYTSDFHRDSVKAFLAKSAARAKG